MAEWKATGIVQGLEVKQVGRNNLDLAEFMVVETYTHQGEEKSRNIPCKCFAQKALDIEKNVSDGCRVEVSGYVNSREYKGRTYVDLSVAKFEVLQRASQQHSPAESFYNNEPESQEPSYDDGDVPF